MREIRRKLMAVMKKHHMDIKEFAEKCGMEEGRMERLLHGRGRLTMLEAGQIAEAFGQTVEEAFDIDAMGYLVKPYEINRMERVLCRSILQVMALKQSVKEPEITVIDENLKKKIICKNIIYIQRQQYKSMVVTPQREYCVYEPIKALYERVGAGFLRVNQSEVVNMDYINTIENNVVMLKNGMQMPVGRTYRKDVMLRYFGAK